MTITLDHLRDYLLNADERAVWQAYPRYMAKQLDADHRSLLATLTDAMLKGLVTLQWGVECPACHARGEAPALAELTGIKTCPACQGQFAAHLDNDVHVTFSVHPSLRKLTDHAQDQEYHLNIVRSYQPTTGHELLTVQGFRNWAQNEVLPPGESLEVGYVAIWFSDLSGSTALYARRGDPQAFRLVREHFDVMFEAVNQSGGAVVKTIGDSVMAAYVSTADALNGAIASHRALAEFNRQRQIADDQLRLKVGLHSGPSIVVTLNERLDYFGQTVNLASRIEGQAGPGQVAFSQAAFDAPGVLDIAAQWPVEAVKTSVKGIEGQIVVNRFTV